MRTTKLCTKLFAALICLALFTGCKKDSNPAQTQSPCKITTISVNGNNGVIIAYNNDGTISSITSGNSVNSYVYNGNTVTETTMNSGQFDTKAIITKNGDGLATNVKTEYSTDGTDWDNEAYEYNGTQIAKLTYTSSDGGSSDISTFQWSGGNLVSVIDTGDTTKIDYFTDKLSQAGDYLSLSQLIQGYEVFRNKNVLKSITNDTDVTNVTYTFDTDGKITSLTENDGTDTYNYGFQYQCN